MGPAGVEFVYKNELREIRGSVAQRIETATQELVKKGVDADQASADARKAVAVWVKEQEALLATRYEKELMNPNEALSLGSISQIVMPSELRKVLGENMAFHLEHYTPQPLTAVQREFH
jgi:acetyl-CoA carboxylase carboxyltransferase component